MKHLQLFWISLGLFSSLNAGGADDLSLLSDEFDSAASIANWSRIYQTEGWGNNALEGIDINTTRAGQMVMMPYTSSWYEEYRGELTYKNVTGDFVVTTDVRPTARSGNSAPQSQYSLAGIMARTPRAMTAPAQWTAGGQNYIFLSLGAASNPGTYQFEVKTTLNSVSTLFITEGAPRAEIQVARLGPHLIALRRNQGGAWTVHRRYFRPDMPATLQAGLTVYTDWPVASAYGYPEQNTRVMTNGAPLSFGGVVAGANPDLIANFEYVRYQRPRIPAALQGANFSEASQVSDAQLLSFLGANANTPGGAATPAEFHLISTSGGEFRAEATVQTNRSYRVQATASVGGLWLDVTNFVATNATFQFLNSGAGAQSGAAQFYRIVSP